MNLTNINATNVETTEKVNPILIKRNNRTSVPKNPINGLERRLAMEAKIEGKRETACALLLPATNVPPENNYCCSQCNEQHCL